MKKANILISLLLLLGCAKKDPGPTSFSFNNLTSSTLYGFTTYYYDGTNFKELSEHGDLEPGGSTEYKSTDFEAVDFYFSYDPDGVLFYSTTSYDLRAHVKNNLDITDATGLDGGTTYYVLNSSDYDLYNVVSFYLSGDQKFEVTSLGDIPAGSRSEIVETAESQLYLEFEFDEGGDTYRANEPYAISDGILNSLEIINSTSVVNQSQTKYLFTNETTVTLYGFTTFYDDGTGDFQDTYEHGTLEPGESTELVSTEFEAVDFYYSYDPDGVKFYSTTSYELTLHEENDLDILGDTEVDGGTTYYVYNQSDFELFDVITFYFDSENILDEVDHGDLPLNTRTRIIQTTRDQIYVEFRLAEGGDQYLVSDPFGIQTDDLNQLLIDNTTSVILVESTARVAPGKADRGKTVKLGDVTGVPY